MDIFEHISYRGMDGRKMKGAFNGCGVKSIGHELKLRALANSKNMADWDSHTILL